METTNNIFVPNILHESTSGATQLSLSSELFRARKVFLIGDVDAESMGTLMQELMILDAESNEPIELYINSAGGMVTSGMAVYRYMTDCMKSPIYTYCIGLAASMASLLYLAGTKRFIYEGTRIILHDPSSIATSSEKPGELKGRLKSLEIAREMICHIIAYRTGHPFDEIAEIIKNDMICEADEALEFGLATEIIKNDKPNKDTDNPFSSNPNSSNTTFLPYPDNKEAQAFSDPDAVVINGIPQSLMRLNRTGRIPVYRFGFGYKFEDDKVIYANIDVKVTSTRFGGGRYSIDLGSSNTQYTCTLSDGSDPIILTADEISKLFLESKRKYIANNLKRRILST